MSSPRLSRMLCRPLTLRVSLSSTVLWSAHRTCSSQPPPLGGTTPLASPPPSSTTAAVPTTDPYSPPVSTDESATRTAATPSSSPSLEEAVKSLHEAVAAWSLVEQQKMDRSRTQGAAPARKPSPTDAIPNTVSNIGTTPATASNTAVSPPASSPGTTTTTMTTATEKATPTTFGVRNKRDRFWAYIYTAPDQRQPQQAAVVPEASDAATAAAAPSTAPSNVASDTADTSQTTTTTPSSNSSTATTAPTTPAAARSPPSSSSSASSPSTTKTTFSSVRQSTALGRSRPHLQPFRSRPKRRVAQSVAQVINLDPNAGEQLVSMMSAESRRLMVVMGTASEYFGGNYGDVVEQVKMADSDRDRLISSEEYDVWASRSFQRRSDAAHKAAATVPSSSPASTAPAHKADAQGTTATAAAAATVMPTTTTTTISPTSSSSSNSSSNSAGSGGQHAKVVRAIQRHPDSEKSKVSTATAATTTPSTTTSPTTTSPTSGAASNATTVARGGANALSRTGSVDCADTQSLTPTMLMANFPSSLPSSLLALVTPEAEKQNGEKQRKDKKKDPSYINWSTWWKLVLVAAPPFFAFGLLDNTTFVLSGDAIDRTMSEAFNLSEMAAAALGGVVSGVAGIQVHGLAEKYTRGTPPPLTAAQKRSPSYLRADHMGNTLGMVLGLIAGMLPLLWLHKHSEDEQNDDIQHDIELMRQEAVKSASRRLQREDKLRHLLEAHQHSEWDDIMKQAKAERAKILLRNPTRTPENLDDRHNPH